MQYFMLKTIDFY